MPELPEVETVRRGLTRLVEGATVDHVEVFYRKMVTPEAEVFTAELIGRKIERIDRRGKYLLFLSGGSFTRPGDLGSVMGAILIMQGLHRSCYRDSSSFCCRWLSAIWCHFVNPPR